jgi:hypothetical protein
VVALGEPGVAAMKLRICVGEQESIVPASLDMVERAFAAETAVRIGTEITLADGARWLAALALEPPTPRAGEEPLQFLLSGGTSGRAVVSGRLGRSEVLRRFRAFLEEAEPSAAG